MCDIYMTREIGEGNFKMFCCAFGIVSDVLQEPHNYFYFLDWKASQDTSKHH